MKKWRFGSLIFFLIVTTLPLLAHRASATPTGEEYFQKKLADPHYDWKQPINFYGRTVDQSNNPVAGADVHFEINDSPDKEDSKISTRSDATGFFSLTNYHGKSLYVLTEKAGYYGNVNSDQYFFEYADPEKELWIADLNKPAIFHLRKRGEGVYLVTSAFKTALDLSMPILRSSETVKVNLFRREIDDEGQLQISATTAYPKNWQLATNWMARMAIPDGGFVEINDEFPFEAPTHGYQTALEFKIQKDQPGWTQSLVKFYYIKFGSPARYGRIRIKINLSQNKMLLMYAFNPDGTRNIEQKLNKFKVAGNSQ